MTASSLPIALQPGTAVRLDPWVPHFDAATLKQLARLFVGTAANKMRKEECLRAVQGALRDLSRLQGLAGGLSDFERLALHLLRAAGGSMSAAELAGALWPSGHPFRSSGYGDPRDPLVALGARGLVFIADQRGTYSFGYGSDYGLTGKIGAGVAFADERLLQHVRPCAPRPLQIVPASPPALAAGRRPAQVSLLLGKIVEGIERAGSVPLTAAGRPTKPGVARVARLLGTGELSDPDLGVALPEAGAFLTGLLLASGLLTLRPQERQAVLAVEAWDRLRQPFDRQAAGWARAYQGLTGWAEFLPATGYYYDGDAVYGFSKLNTLRAALLTALAALPDPDGWYRLSDLTAALHKVLAGRLSLLSLPHQEGYARTEQEQQKLRAEYLEERDAVWRDAEVPWIEQAVRGPLYYLGLVELGAGPDDQGLLLRLSEVARAAVWGALRGEEREAAAPPEPARCWIVQPNLDVIVFMDRVSAEQLTFLARVAAQESAQANAAEYRLTRASVYRALESGLSADAILAGLAAGSERPLPDSLRRTLADWASRRERIRFRQRASLLEFPDTAARDAAAARLGLEGAAVGERFLRLESEALPEGLSLSARLDYRTPPRRCLTVAEDGGVTAAEPLDLPARAALSRWAEAVPDRRDAWRLTAASVASAVAAGRYAEQLLTILNDRVPGGALPPLLRIALRAWASGRPQPGASLSAETVLHLDDPVLIEAVPQSTLLRGYLGRQLGPGSYVVSPEAAAELRALLAAFGVEPAPALPAERGRRAAAPAPPVLPESPEVSRGRRRRGRW